MIAIYDWFGYSLDIKERYRLIKEAGFDGVLLWWSDGFGRGEYRNAPELIRKAGLIIENIHTPVQNQNDLWLDNLKGEAEADCYMNCVSDCAEFEIPTMVVHLPDDEYVCNDLGIYRVNKIAERAERLGIKVAMENLRNLNNLTRVLAEVKSEAVGYCYDACHSKNYAGSRDFLAEYGERLMALHLHDNGGIHNQHQLPFDGGIDWEAVMKAIAATGYSGTTALEPMNWDYTELTAEQFLKLAAQKARRLEELRNCQPGQP